LSKLGLSDGLEKNIADRTNETIRAELQEFAFDRE
jgi:hypothetical protein